MRKCFLLISLIAFLAPVLAVGVQDSDAIDTLLCSSQSEEDVYTHLIELGYLGEELKSRYMEWRSAQKPLIEPEALIQIFEAKRDSLVDGICNFSVQIDSMRNPLRTDIEWSFSNEKKLRTTTSFWYNTGVESTIRRSYNGEELRIYRDATNSGEIRPFSGDHEFFGRFDVLTFAMLTRKENFDHFCGWCDLVHLLNIGGIIQEAIEQIDGHDCLVVLYGTPAATKIYLDIDKNFSVRRIVQYRQTQPREGGAWADSRVLSTWSDLLQLQYFGNGIWLPSVVDTVLFNADSEAATTIQTTLHNAAFNIGVAPEAFDLFPADAVVTDTVNHIIFRNFGDPDEVQHYIDRRLFTLPERTSNE